MSMNSRVNTRSRHKSFLQKYVNFRAIIAELTMLGVLFLVCSPGHADIIWGIPTIIYFSVDGEPHNKDVDFTINCYGYWTNDRRPQAPKLPTGTYTPELVFSFSDTCGHYGCEVYMPGGWSIGRVIDHCDCEGETEGRQFFIEDYASSPVPDNCGGWWAGYDPCELTFDIAASSEVTDSDTSEDSADADGGGGGGCFVAAVLSP